MTVPSALDRVSLLSERLAVLRVERAPPRRDPARGQRRHGRPGHQRRGHHPPASCLDQRIAVLELEIADCERERHRHTDGIISVGDVVTVDLGDGEETYLIGSVEEAAAGIDTITPLSPLSHAIVGAAVGATTTYEPRRGVTMTVTICSAGQLLTPSA